MFLVIGAGDVERIAEWARESLACATGDRHGRALPFAADWEAQLLEATGAMPGIAARRDVPLAPLTTLKVGGSADALVEARSEPGLSALWQWAAAHNVPCTVLGNGSNVLVSDLGVRGIVVRLRGERFSSFQRRNAHVIVGGGLRLASLLNRLEQEGLGGLSFLEGIPGTVGGALRMNAGAWGDEIGRHVAWIRLLNADGAMCRLDRRELGFGYRQCRALAGRGVVLEAGFDLEPSAADTIAAERREVRKRKRWMRGRRSAGSVFRNPGPEPAGRLIEQAGFKGARVGGVRVSEQHANIWVADGADACSSDFRALMEWVRAGVTRHSGVELEPEVESLS
jgi:UDP-N-acetylmuramate dehydrogenase